MDSHSEEDAGSRHEDIERENQELNENDSNH
jgi:hypothetical protein